ARGGGAPDADYASLPLERATGGRGGRRQRLPWILLPLRRYEHGPSVPRHGAVDDRYRAADGWRPRRARVFRKGWYRRAGKPPPGGRALSPRGVGLVRDRLAADHDVVAARSIVRHVGVQGVRRGDDSVSARARIADAPDRRAGMAGFHSHLQVGQL